jgi:ectoine hydroxylase-related dioxygenase (phytanoyl-CoA dioxygenase family)
MGIKLTQEQLKTFDEDGVLCLRGVIAPEWVEKLKIAAEKDLAEPGRDNEEYPVEGRIFNDFDTWRHVPEARDFAFNGPYPEIAAQLMRSKQVNFFMDQLIVKFPGTPATTPWHQDTTYMGVDGRNFITFWTTTRPVPKELTVEYVKGSHKWGTLFAPFREGAITTGESTSYAFRQLMVKLPEGEKHEGYVDKPIPSIESNREAYDIVGFDVDPGDCIVFFANMAHKGQGNPSDPEARFSCIFRYLGDDATFAVRNPPAEFPKHPPKNARHGVPMREYEKDFPRVYPELL